MYFKFVALYLILLRNNVVIGRASEEFTWRYLNFTFRSPEEYRRAIRDGTYDYRKNILVDADRDVDGRLFLSVRRDHGVPASLVTVNTSHIDPSTGQYLLSPYPNWESTDIRNCNSIINAAKIRMNSCFVWVLDSGYVGFNVHCPPKIMKFTIAPDQLVETVQIPQHCFPHSNYNMGMVSNIFEDNVNCNKSIREAELFITDSVGGGLIVYKDGKFRRFESSNMAPQLAKSYFFTNKRDVYLPFGISDLALSRQGDIYFSSLTSNDISTTKKSNFFQQFDPPVYKTYKNILPNSATQMSFAIKGALVVALTGESSIICIPFRNNTLYPNKMEIVERDRNKLNFVSSLKIFPGTGYEKVVMVSNKMTRFLAGSMDFGEINFRVFFLPAEELLQKKCE